MRGSPFTFLHRKALQKQRRIKCCSLPETPRVQTAQLPDMIQTILQRVFVHKPGLACFLQGSVKRKIESQKLLVFLAEPRQAPGKISALRVFVYACQQQFKVHFIVYRVILPRFQASEGKPCFRAAEILLQKPSARTDTDFYCLRVLCGKV